MQAADRIKEPFTPGNERGYSCQTVLSKRVNEYLHPGTYHCWFSLEFNPHRTGNSSNPLWLYQTLSKAVEERDVNEAKIQQIRTALMEAVTRNSPLSGSPETNEAIVHIRYAPIELFRPQIWSIKVSETGGRTQKGHQYPAERKIEDLRCEEFETIIE